MRLSSGLEWQPLGQRCTVQSRKCTSRRGILSGLLHGNRLRANLRSGLSEGGTFQSMEARMRHVRHTVFGRVGFVNAAVEMGADWNLELIVYWSINCRMNSAWLLCVAEEPNSSCSASMDTHLLCPSWRCNLECSCPRCRQVSSPDLRSLGAAECMVVHDGRVYTSVTNNSLVPSPVLERFLPSHAAAEHWLQEVRETLWSLAHLVGTSRRRRAFRLDRCRHRSFFFPTKL
ncbi:uncharacterized protein B0H64DRAFT_55943 [Chaetomium fimeti]|uniref:Uncharacterized protein n=1 Tax=Chaetomium fimeti TaxID=1854472 RepID=A0AAE0LMX6_9PEZI|nr:hypothetical protein B0H64DRAFT_55943 [Chaetomium fimeti]